MNLKLTLFFCILGSALCLPSPVHRGDKDHPRHNRGRRSTYYNSQGDESDPNFWFDKGQNILENHLNVVHNTNTAKNVILFLGDGMSIPTLTGARIFQGQQNGVSGEEGTLFFERFPYTGLSRTYCVDSQVPDSACTATAYLCGVKTNEGTIGVCSAVGRDDCGAMTNVSNHVYSIGRWAQEAGKATGVVTTTRITHASPAGVYAHTAERDWEDDSAIALDGEDPLQCTDIATQLVTGETGRNLNVIMGGGRTNFLPLGLHDGTRLDGVDLIELWQQMKAEENRTYVYVKERDQLLEISEPTDYLLGLFAKSHLNYHLEDEADEPTLAEMTERAIKNLEKFENGYFLFVEGGLIDKGHHSNRAQRALDETLEFAKAIELAASLTSEEDTLIVVTADHAHTMTVNGYAPRGNQILGIAGEGDDNLPYATLSYSNGPGYLEPDTFGHRHDLTNDNMVGIKYRFPAMVPLDSETHGGDDVAVFARGPWSHLFTGSFEQNFIPYGMAYASCIGHGKTACDRW